MTELHRLIAFIDYAYQKVFIRHLLTHAEYNRDEFDLQQKDLIPIFKTESIASAILKGQKKFTIEHIEKLADFLKVSPAASFSQPG